MKRLEITVELNDGTSHDLVIANPSLVAWDRTRAKWNWPKADDATLLWMTFVAWHHMKAHGLVKCEYTEFEEKVCLDVSDTVKPLTEKEQTRLAVLEAQADRTAEEEAELEGLQERADKADPDEDPTPPAHELDSSSS